MREFTINGNKFHTPKGFHKYTEELFTFNLSWKTGRNLDAFADILHGGFGQHEYGEMIRVKWININKSKERLSTQFYNDVIEILEEVENVIFEKSDYRN